MRCQKQSKRQMRAGAFPRELRASGPVLTHPMEQLTGGVCQELPGALWCRGSLSAGAFSFHLIINAKQCQCLHITCVRWLTGAKLEQIPWKDRTCSLVPR